jgi:hypothetical protein
MKFLPLPKLSMVQMLQTLSTELDWGTCSGKVIPFGDGTNPCLMWESNKWRDMDLTFCCVQRELTRAQIIQGTKPRMEFQVCAVSWNYRIYAGTVRFSLPSTSGVLGLAKILAPMLHRSNFETKKSRFAYVDKYPSTLVPNDTDETPWKSTVHEVVRGKVVVDQSIHKEWLRHLANLQREKTNNRLNRSRRSAEI